MKPRVDASKGRNDAVEAGRDFLRLPFRGKDATSPAAALLAPREEQVIHVFSPQVSADLRDQRGPNSMNGL